MFSEDNFPTPTQSLSSKQSGAWKSEVPLTAVRLLHVTAERLWLQNLLEDTAGPRRSGLLNRGAGEEEPPWSWNSGHRFQPTLHSAPVSVSLPSMAMLAEILDFCAKRLQKPIRILQVR